MRKGYRKILIYQLILFTIFFINSFVSNILGTYTTILFLVVALAVFKFFFGFERVNSRFVKDIFLEITIFMLIFFILFYLLGIFIGFARIENYYSVYGMKTFVIPLIITTILKEILRYMIVSKSDGSFILTCTS